MSEWESESKDEEKLSSKVHGLVRKIRDGKNAQRPKGWYRTFRTFQFLNVHHGYTTRWRCRMCSSTFIPNLWHTSQHTAQE